MLRHSIETVSLVDRSLLSNVLYEAGSLSRRDDIDMTKRHSEFDYDDGKLGRGDMVEALTSASVLPFIGGNLQRYI